MWQTDYSCRFSKAIKPLYKCRLMYIYIIEIKKYRKTLISTLNLNKNMSFLY